MSAHELAKGFTRPIITHSRPTILPSEILTAHEKLIAKRKLMQILRSKTVAEPSISVGDIVEVFIKRENEKRGKWTSPKPVISVDADTFSVTVPGKNGRKNRAAFEDIRLSVANDNFSKVIQDAIDALDASLDIYLTDNDTTTGTDNSADTFTL